MVRIAVLGAGVVGLTTAVNVQKEVPTSKITLISDNFANDTTSSGSGGLFIPDSPLIKGVSPEAVK